MCPPAMIRQDKLFIANGIVVAWSDKILAKNFGFRKRECKIYQYADSTTLYSNSNLIPHISFVWFYINFLFLGRGTIVFVLGEFQAK